MFISRNSFRDVSILQEEKIRCITAAQKKCGHSALAFAKAVARAKEVYFSLQMSNKHLALLLAIR